MGKVYETIARAFGTDDCQKGVLFVQVTTMKQWHSFITVSLGRRCRWRVKMWCSLLLVLGTELTFVRSSPVEFTFDESTERERVVNERGVSLQPAKLDVARKGRRRGDSRATFVRFPRVTFILTPPVESSPPFLRALITVEHQRVCAI